MPCALRPVASRAFTLIEATLAIAVTSILLAAMGAALTMTIGATDAGDDSSSRATRAADALQQLNAELSVATSLTTFTASDIVMTVPDRNSDGAAEIIEYTWTGRPGDPLLRSYNKSTGATVAADVRSISVAAADRLPAQPVESSERTLMSCDAPSGSSSTTFSVDDKNSAAQYVRPVLPTGAVSWKITKVRMYLTRTNGSGKQLRLSIRTADANLKPTTTILASVSYSSSVLSNGAGGWVETAITYSGISATQGVCIVLDGQVDTGTADVTYYQNGSNLPYNTHFTTSSNNTTWSTPTDTKDMRFSVSGTYTTMVEP